MEHLQYYHYLICYLLLALRDPVFCAKEITVTPAKPLVKLGDAVTLACVTTCPNGRPQWKELDESDATLNTTEKSGYLHIAAVRLDHEGKYTCTTATCKQQKKETIQLRVYSLPVAVLSTVPENPVSGQPFKVKCTLTNVYHRDDDDFEINLFHREKLETEHSENCDDGRFCNYTQFSKDQMDTGNTDYQCEARLTIGQQSFTEKTCLTIRFQVGSLATQTAEPVNKEDEGQVGSLATQTAEPVNKEDEGQVGSLATQTAEPVNKEDEGQVVEASFSTTTAIAALGSTVGFLAILCFLAQLIQWRKRRSPPSGPKNHPDGC